MENWIDCFLLLSEELSAKDSCRRTSVKTSETQLVEEFKKKKKKSCLKQVLFFKKAL